MATSPIWDRTLASAGRRRLTSRPRPYTFGSLPVLVGAMVVIPLVGLLFSGGFAAYGQCINLILLLAWILVWIFRNAENSYVAWTLLAARVGTVAVATIFIEPYYLSRTGSDAELYHSVGMQIAQTLWMNGALPITGLNWGTNCYSAYTGVCYLLFGPYPLAVKLLNTGIAAAGSILFYKAYVFYYGRRNRALRLLLFFSPTLLYWSSIHGKDPLTFFSLGLGFWGTVKFSKDGSRGGFFLCLLAALCLFMIRPHVACVYLGALSVMFLFRSLSAKKSTATRFASVSCLILVILFANFVINDYIQDGAPSADAILARVSTQHDGLDTGNSALEVPSLRGWQAAMAYLPYGAITVMFRPFPWESGGFFFRLTSLEQLVVSGAELIFIGYFLLALLNGSLRGMRQMITRDSIDALTVFVTAYLIGFVLLFTYIAGNLGSLAREKIQLAPFILCAAFGVASRYRAVFTPASLGEAGDSEPQEIAASEDGKDGRRWN
jgi:hypothetical protein